MARKAERSSSPGPAAPGPPAPGPAARNLLAVDPEREQRVRERAYLLWEAEGRPHGRDVEYWERARALVGIEESAGGAVLANPPSAASAQRRTGVAEAALQDNPGASPDRLTDKGEVRTTPVAKRKSRAKVKKPAS
jgi:hypothetical protein